MKLDVSYEYTRDNNVYPMSWICKDDACIPHFHSSLEFVFVVKGEISALVDSQIYIITEGSLLIVPSYAVHSYTTKTTSDSYVLTIPLSSIPSYKFVFEKQTFSSLHIKTSTINKELLHCLESIRICPKDMASIHYTNMLKGYTYVFLSIIMNEVGLTNILTKKKSSLAQNILIYIEEHFLETLSLDGLAENFGYSKSRFSHIFNEYFGCKLTDYINSLRCRYALELLTQRDMTITDIALASGFESTRTFYRAFKRQYDETPMGFEQRSKDKNPFLK